MRFILTGLLAAFFVTSGCAFLEDEQGYPGGYTGRIADNRILQTRSHDQRIARYAYSLALIAPLLAETAQTPEEAQASANAISAVYKKLGLLKDISDDCRLQGQDGLEQSLFATCVLAPDESGGPIKSSAFTFESHAFEADRTMVRLAKTVADNLGVRGSLSRARNLTILDLAKSIYRARRVIPVAMRYFATYRDVSLIVSDAMVQSCVPTDDKRAECTDLRNKLLTNLSERNVVDDYRPIARVFETAQQRARAGKQWSFAPRHFQALVSHVDRACMKLEALQTIDGDAEAKCASGDNRTNFLKAIQ